MIILHMIAYQARRYPFYAWVIEAERRGASVPGGLLNRRFTKRKNIQPPAWVPYIVSAANSSCCPV